MILTLLLTLQPFICSQCARNYREPKILTSLHANKWACTVSWDAGGRHKSPRLEMRNIAHTSDLQFHRETLLPCQETNWPFATRYSLCFSRLLANILGKLVVQLLIRVWLFVTPWSATHQTPLSFTVSWNLLKLMSIKSAMPYSHLILRHPLFLLSSISPSIRVFSSESALHIRWPKYWSFSFSISPSNEHSGLISFRMDSFGLLAVLWSVCLSLCRYHAVLITVALCVNFKKSISIF